MEKDGTINKLIDIFKEDKYKDLEIKNNISLLISYLFKATSLPTEYGLSIINNLKDNISSTN
jgi:hypothetical protein